VEKQDEETVANAAEDDEDNSGSVASGRPVKGILDEDSDEFNARCDNALERACEKYAWVAQHEGIVLRKNPLKQPPMKEWVYRRIAKADYGIRYRDGAGRKRLWYPDLPTMLNAYYEPEYAGDILFYQPFLIAERIEFLPGEPEISHDADKCRVLNLWHPPSWKEDENAGEPTSGLLAR